MKASQHTKRFRMKVDRWRIYGTLSLIAALSGWADPAKSFATLAVFPIAGGEYHSLALKSDGTVWAWGWNQYGALGDGTTNNRATAVQVSGLSGVVATGGGGFHSLALKSDGTVWAWGNNGGGELGDGTTIYRLTPVQVGGLSGVVALAGGGFHSLALKSDGTVWACGQNNEGQLGDGTTIDRSNAVQVSGLSGVVALAGGELHSLALKSDGTVWAWGWNQYGALGDGTTNNRATPVQVSGLSGVVALAGGYNHSLALKSDGTIWAWGNNASGELGDGTTTQRLTPVQVSALRGVIALAGGGFHSLALKSDGTVWACGRNNEGQLGDGTTTQRLTPVQVGGLSGVVALAGGEYHSLAIKSDGTVWAWGLNFYGELGDGTTTQRNTPVQAQGLNSPCMTFTMSIAGDATIPDNASKYFSATAQFQDGSTQDVSQASAWKIVGINYGSSFSGNTLTAGTVSQATPITIQATYSCGGSIVTSPPLTVTINPQLLASVSILTGYQNRFPNQQIQLAATTVGGTGSSQYQWSLPGSSQNGGLTASSTWVSYSQSGTYLATVIVQNASLYATGFTYVVVNSPPVPNQPPVATPMDPIIVDMRDSLIPTNPLNFNSTWSSRKNNGLIIITHGLRDSAMSGWMAAMARAITNRFGPSQVPNIALLNWQAQADPSGLNSLSIGISSLDSYGTQISDWIGNAELTVADLAADIVKIRHNGVQQGVQLADWITRNIANGNINPSAPIQIIGHSAGGFVAGECANHLVSHVSQVTMLDTPCPVRSHFTGYGSQGKIERYITSQFGLLCDQFQSTTPAPGDENLFCQLPFLFCESLPIINHNSNYYREPLASQYGIGWPLYILYPTVSAHFASYIWYTQTITNGIQDGFYYSPFTGHALPSMSVPSQDFAALVSSPSAPTLSTNILSGFSTFGNVTVSNGNYRLVEAGDAGIFQTITFPAGVQSISFSYCFTTPGTGDFLSVTMGTNTVLYVGPDIGITQDPTNYMNAEIDIPQTAGLTDQLVFKLVSRGSTNAVLTISNITMTVNLDVNHDSVGDGVADWWRQQFFSGQQYFGGDGTTTNGFTCATCDVDGTGQNNMFKYVAGLDPTNPASVFALGLVNTANQPQTMSLNLYPLALGRHYTPQFSTDLVKGVWLPLPGYTGPVTNGNQVTITDTSAVSPQKFYRIDISYP